MGNEVKKRWVLPLELSEQTLPVLEQVTGGMPGGFFIYRADGDETLIYANEAMAYIFGCGSLEEFRDHVHNSFRGIVHPEDLDRVERSIETQIAHSSRGLDYVEYRILRRDGVVRWIRDYGRFVHTELYGDVFYVFVEDTTERHLRELSEARAVQMARERLEVLRQLEHETAALRMVHEIFSSSMWSLEFDELCQISCVRWSDEFRAMLGYRGETDFPNSLEAWSDLLHEEDKERVLTALYNAVHDESDRKSCSVKYRLLTRDRGWRWFHAVGKVFRREDGTPSAFVGIVADITRQRLTEEALEAQRRLLEDAFRQTQRAKRAKSVFLSNMSHDLRTPMNAITGFATLAKMSAVKPDVTGYLDEILAAADDLEVLIRDLLDMSRLESGEADLHEAPCALAEILWDLEASARAEAHARQLSLSVESEGLIHACAVCDRRQLQQALANLLEDALKFTPAGGKITLRLAETPGAPAGYAFYVFTVRDTGAGIDPALLAHIFEPLDREQTAQLGSTQGLGMSMAITKNLIDKMGGSIRVESGETGSEFTISLQFRLPEAENT